MNYDARSTAHQIWYSVRSVMQRVRALLSVWCTWEVNKPTVNSYTRQLGKINMCVCVSDRVRDEMFNPMKPNDPYRGLTAPLTSTVAFYIFIQ